jgi:hypothetical protein
LDKGINEMRLFNINKVNGMSQMSQQIESDDIHNTKTARRVFIDSILSDIKAFFKAELVYLKGVMEDTDMVKYILTPHNTQLQDQQQRQEFQERNYPVLTYWGVRLMQSKMT